LPANRDGVSCVRIRRRHQAPSTTELALLGEEPDTALVLRSTRAQPGLLVQGDRLSIAMRAAEEALSGLRSGRSPDARQSAQEVADILREWQTSYERMMQKARRELPYSNE
jgi:hypothetical protein